jgi:hypothetical protein
MSKVFHVTFNPSAGSGLALRPLTFLLLSFFLLGCKPASPTPQAVSVSTKEPTLMPSAPRSTQHAPSWWHPTAGLTWQWQIGDNDIDTSIEADVYDIDLYVDQAIMDELHAKGRKIICYMSVGSYEDWRPDIDQFPPEVLGNNYDGWAGEKWLDIRRIDLFAPIMRARLDLCKAKGFDAVEPDNMEIYTNDTGFPLTYDDQLKFALWLADEAHKRGLAIGQKNASDQVAQLVDVYDFAITEDYFYYGDAESMLPYIKANKPVFAAEYTDLPGDFSAFCDQSKKLNFSTILKKRGLDAWVKYCP